MGVKQSEIEIIVSKCVDATILAVCLHEAKNIALPVAKLESELHDVVRHELTKAGVHVQRKRTAEVDVRPGPDIELRQRRQLETVRSYLPANYEASIYKVGKVNIEGYDRAGWTLDDYVIPRLASGLIVAKETTRR